MHKVQRALELYLRGDISARRLNSILSSEGWKIDTARRQQMNAFPVIDQMTGEQTWIEI